MVTVTLEDGGHTGRGECVPYPRYEETVPQVMAALEAARSPIEAGITRDAIASILTPHAARNALDCALWDLAAKKAGKPVWQLAGLAEPKPAVTAYTLSLDTPEAMGEAAAKASGRPLLKLKLGREGDVERLKHIRRNAPHSRLIVDANEGWTALRAVSRAVTVCADESAHGLDSLDQLVGKYDAINIKLDKTGGLTPAIALARAARERDLRVMVGCMLATSLAMAPAFLLTPFAEVIDLDGPLLLKEDRSPAIRFDGSLMHPAPADLWG